MLNPEQLLELIIKPALYELQLYSDDAAELLLFTCAVESNGGHFLKQVNGPALGIYQMEPETYTDIWANFIVHKQSILSMFAHNFSIMTMPSEDRLIYDLRFATAMTRLHYRRVNEPLPSKDDVNAIWEYYKKYYNTIKGSAEKLPSITKYKVFIKA